MQLFRDDDHKLSVLVGRRKKVGLFSHAAAKFSVQLFHSQPLLFPTELQDKIGRFRLPVALQQIMPP